MSGLNLIPFGYNPDNDTFVDVKGVPRGAQCGCICPACKTPLIARHGEEKEWHFAHASRKVYEKTQKECEFSFYLSVRMMARQIIEDELNITLPEYKDSVSKYIPDLGYPLYESFVITESKEISLTNISVESIFEGVAVDVVGYIRDFKFAVYFTHPGRVVPHELKSPKDRHCGVISIALDGLHGSIFRDAKRRQISYQSVLADFLANDILSKEWVFHPRYERCQQQAVKRLEDEADRILAQAVRHNSSAVPALDMMLNVSVKKRVLLECVMCKAQWTGYEPGERVCPKCNASSHLFIRSIGDASD